MVSVLLVFGINLYLAGGSSSIYKSQPLANIAGVVLLILGIILTVVGFRKSE
jgi:energy-converting hydrogenase Eha subunit C